MSKRALLESVLAVASTAACIAPCTKDVMSPDPCVAVFKPDCMLRKTESVVDIAKYEYQQLLLPKSSIGRLGYSGSQNLPGPWLAERFELLTEILNPCQ